MGRTVIPVRIASGTSLSDEIFLNNKRIVGIAMPAAWSAAGIAFRARFALLDYYRNKMALGPLAYWRLGEPSGTAAGAEVGGVGVYVASPTLGVASALAADANTAATFNGTTQRVTVATAPAIVDTFSIATWFKRSATQGAIQHLVSFATGGPALFLDAANKLCLSMVDTGNIWVSTPAYTDTNWHMAVATKTGATIAIYVDGIAVAGTTTNQTCTAAATLALAATQAAASWFPGSLDEVAVFGRALTLAEVTALYLMGIAPAFVDMTGPTVPAISSPAAGVYVAIPDTLALIAPGRIMVRSGTNASPVNQVAERNFSLICVDI